MPNLTLVDAASRMSPVAEGKKKNWIRRAVPKERRGVFRAKAEAAGKSTREFAKEHEGDSGTLGKEARLAENLMGLSHKRKKLYDNPRSRKD